MSKHTPGPDFQYCLRFMAELNGQTWITGEDIVCENMRVRAKAVHKHLWGNHKLYEAAPDLLAALIDAREELSRIAINQQGISEEDLTDIAQPDITVICRADFAIAKAKRDT